MKQYYNTINVRLLRELYLSNFNKHIFSPTYGVPNINHMPIPGKYFMGHVSTNLVFDSSAMT